MPKVFRKSLFSYNLDTQIPLCYYLPCLGEDSDHWKRRSLEAQKHAAWSSPAVLIKAERSEAPGWPGAALVLWQEEMYRETCGIYTLSEMSQWPY